MKTAIAAAAALGFFAVRSLIRQSYKDQVVMITGGSRGLGFALASQLIKQKATVILLARDAKELRTACEKLGPGAASIRCDVTDPKALTRAVAKVQSDYGRIDTFIHNAGFISVGPFAALTDDDYQLSVDLHLNASITAVRALREIMQPGSRICLISSVGGRVGLPHMSAYSATKFAMAGFADAVRPELASQGISLTAAYPGLMRTGSPEKATMKGDVESEFMWFAAADHLPFFSMAADRASRKILTAVIDRRSEIIVGWSAKVLVLMRALAPELTALSMRAANATLPKSESRVGVKGEKARAKFDESSVAAPLRARERRARQQWNQQET